MNENAERSEFQPMQENIEAEQQMPPVESPFRAPDAFAEAEPTVQEHTRPSQASPNAPADPWAFRPAPPQMERSSYDGYYTDPMRYRPPQNVQPDPLVREQPKKKPKKKRTISVGKAIALMLCCAVIGGAMGIGGVFLGRYLAGEDAVVQGGRTQVYEGVREVHEIDTIRVETDKLLSAAEVYAQNVNSTVGITTSITTNYWGYQTTSAASGSGFVLTADGYILTNFHVIESSDSITVTMYDGTSYDAGLIGYDESNDIAVLKVEAQGLTPVVLGDSSDMNVGDPVVAIGNPLGELTFSLTQGAISAMERDVTMSNGVVMNLMQTDCAINSGNSGGALFNLYGEVIGITNAKYSSNGYSSEASIDNIGFAIPINSVRGIVESLIEKGYVSKPYIGVNVSDVSEEALNYGLPKGASILSVQKNSPAEDAGLQANDIVTEVNGEKIKGRKDLADIIAAGSVGDRLELTVYRRGETLTLTVTIGEQKQTAVGNSSDEQGDYPWGN